MTEFPLTNLKPDLSDRRDFIFSGSAALNLPRRVDLRRFAGAIEQQGNTNSCTGNAGASACEIWMDRAGKPKDFSRLFLYYNEREEYPNLHGQDNGAYMRDICRCLNKQGICLESSWPFHVWDIHTKPPQSCYDEAANYKVGRYERIETWDTQGVKRALAMGCPVLVGMYLREPFMRLPASEDNYGWFIQQGYFSHQQIGSHAMLIVGYDDDKQYWILENSWGTGWGDHGYGYVPQGYFSDVHDYWVFTEFAGMSMDADKQTVARLYTAALNRKPDDAGLEYWTGQLKGGMPLKEIAAAFASSPEFVGKYGSVNDADFVKLLYNNVLKRDPDAGGAMYWRMRLNPEPKCDRIDVLVSFSESSENRNVS